MLGTRLSGLKEGAVHTAREANLLRSRSSDISQWRAKGMTLALEATGGVLATPSGHGVNISGFHNIRDKEAGPNESQASR